MNSFLYETLEDLAQACVCNYHGMAEKAAEKAEILSKRTLLARWIEKFHQDCGTLNSKVEESIKNLQNGPCLFLMTAHQPNLFAYGGVLRKATLNQVLAERLSRELKLPVVSFFGLADQDFTDDRWVKSALLPDVERRDGILEIRVDLPEKTILNKVGKPSRQVVDRWRHSIGDWLERNSRLVSKLVNSPKHTFEYEKTLSLKNLDEFWSVIEQAYSKADAYSDFNAFIMSRIINDMWGYSTLFARFSECQQIFGSEFCWLLSHFDEYSQYVREATLSLGSSTEGVYELEYKTIPFWYHCDCGSKARLMSNPQRAGFVADGTCSRCGREFQLDFSSKAEPDISNILTKISARSLSMPLVFSEGLCISCYVGGTAGSQYLQQAKHVAERMGMLFPPVVVWRPRDIYSGIGQLGALSVFEDLSGNTDFSEYQNVKARLEKKITDVQSQIEALELQKMRLAKEVVTNKQEKFAKTKSLSFKQHEIRKKSHYSLLSRKLKLIENIRTVIELYPCIIDYAVNIGLKETSEQWIRYLKENGSLISDVNVKAEFTMGARWNMADVNIR